MKHPSRAFAALLCGLFLSLLLFISLTSQSRFTALCDSLFCEELESNSLTLHYTVENPKSYGIDPSRITLGSEESDFSQKVRLVRHFLTLQTIARSRLTKEQQTTYDLLQYTLGVKLDSFRFDKLTEPLVPSIGIQSQLPVLLAEYAFSSEQDVINYLKLLSCMPEYFDSILAV